MKVLIRYIHGVSFILLMSVGALVAACFLAPCVLLLPVKVENYATSLVVVFCNTRIRIYYDGTEEEWTAEARDVSKGVIVMANHRTRIDWMFVGWCYAYFINKVATMKIILATTLKFVPFFGWSMQALAFIFLARERAKDLPHIAKSISYSLNVEPSSPCMLIFPEGTDLAPVNQEKCDAFLRAKQEKLAEQAKEGRADALMKHELRWFKSQRRFTLYPKMAGLACIVKEYIRYYRKRHELCSVAREGHSPTDPCIILHDLTIAYKDYKHGCRSSDLSLLQGEFPPEVHIHVRKAHIPIERQAETSVASSTQVSVDVPADGTEDVFVSSKIEQYLQDSFMWKELLLSQYYTNVNTSQDSQCVPPMTPPGVVRSQKASVSIANVFDTSALQAECAKAEVIQWPGIVLDSRDHYWKMVVIFLFYCAAFGSVVFLIFTTSVLTEVFLKVCIMYVIVGVLGQGADMMELKYHWDYICAKDNAPKGRNSAVTTATPADAKTK